MKINVTVEIPDLVKVIKIAEEGLTPFVKYAEMVSDKWPNETGCCLYWTELDPQEWPNPNLGHCRKAAEALKKLKSLLNGDQK